MDNESVLIHSKKCSLIIGEFIIKGVVHLTTREFYF